MSNRQVWLITGASSGFGRAVTEVALSKGDLVVAAVRSPSSLDELVKTHTVDQLIVQACDVTQREDISAVFKRAYQQFGRCDVVFNNAGIGYVSEVENEEQDAMARRLFEVNFWGAVNVSREAVRCFRELNPPGNGGLLLINSSVCGQVGSVGGGYYSASKHALEGLTGSFAKEISPRWNIRISMIEASAFNTRLFTETTILAPPPGYENPSLATQQLRQLIQTQTLGLGDVVIAAERIHSLGKVASPPFRLPLGKPAVDEIREKYKRGEEEIQRFESWSEGLDLTG